MEQLKMDNKENVMENIEIFIPVCLEPSMQKEYQLIARAKNLKSLVQPGPEDLKVPNP